MQISSGPHYAGFWLRLIAHCIDMIILWVVWFIISLLIDMPIVALMKPSSQNFALSLSGILMYFAIFIGFWLYFALFESSKWQATIGKHILGIKVTDYSGGRISFGRATGRYFAKILSALILYIGYIMIAFTKKKQGLHDIIAKTLVIKS